ncbi:MAG: DJ-1/PfpI family protein [Mycoplasma sp.]|nr:DJ-1/PfpI family protein [Candidatus Hennigella equi]
MKTSIAIIVANQCEEMEVIIPADIWRRAGISVQIISIEKKKSLIMQNGVHISCDDILAKENLSKYSAIYLPGGKGCSSFLDPVQCAKLVSHLRKAAGSKIIIMANCAAPTVLNQLGIIDNVKVTCYPGYEVGLKHHVKDDVVFDKNFITSKAAGTTIDFALAVIKKFVSPAKAKETAKQICYKYWK